MAHGDYSAQELKLLEKYKLTKKFGVSSLLEDIHYLREHRFYGTDTTFLSCLLVDFERVLEKARLTPRQQQVLYFRYEKDWTQAEIAEYLGISQQAVARHIETAIGKIVIIAKMEVTKHERVI